MEVARLDLHDGLRDLPVREVSDVVPVHLHAGGRRREGSDIGENGRDVPYVLLHRQVRGDLDEDRSDGPRVGRCGIQSGGGQAERDPALPVQAGEHEDVASDDDCVGLHLKVLGYVQ